MTWEIVLIFIAAIVSLISSIIGGLVMYSFRSIIVRLDKVDNRIDKVETEFKQLISSQAACKIDCSREFVSAESYVRSEAYNRNKIDKIDNNMALMLGEMKYIKQMPEASAQIAGNVARQIIQEMKSEK